MSAALDLDLATLVGELPDVACEHHQHTEWVAQGWPDHVDKPASHYAQSFCDCGYVSRIAAVCPAYVAHVLTGQPGRCRECMAIMPLNQLVRILGPVNGRAS